MKKSCYITFKYRFGFVRALTIAEFPPIGRASHPAGRKDGRRAGVSNTATVDGCTRVSSRGRGRQQRGLFRGDRGDVPDRRGPKSSDCDSEENQLRRSGGRRCGSAGK